MRASLNHVSVSAVDLETSARFYEEVFGLSRIDSPNFGFPTCWLQAGDLQLHLFQRDVQAPAHHHFALTVDDIEAVYRKAADRLAFDIETAGVPIRELPDGSVQLYLRDPAGNLVEVDFPDASRIDRRVIAELPRLEDQISQSAANKKATLFRSRRP